jgi:hypothetical protein
MRALPVIDEDDPVFCLAMRTHLVCTNFNTLPHGVVIHQRAHEYVWWLEERGLDWEWCWPKRLPDHYMIYMRDPTMSLLFKLTFGGR